MCGGRRDTERSNRLSVLDNIFIFSWSPVSETKALTPEKRQTSVPSDTFVNSTSSATQVTICVPSDVIATVPEVCKGRMDLAFLNLNKDKRCH
jgi:hypothetical protein